MVHALANRLTQNSIIIFQRNALYNVGPRPGAAALHSRDLSEGRYAYDCLCLSVSVTIISTI